MWGLILSIVHFILIVAPNMGVSNSLIRQVYIYIYIGFRLPYVSHVSAVGPPGVMSLYVPTFSKTSFVGEHIRRPGLPKTHPKNPWIKSSTARSSEAISGYKIMVSGSGWVCYAYLNLPMIRILFKEHKRTLAKKERPPFRKRTSGKIP